MSVVFATKNYVQDPAFRNFNWTGAVLPSYGPAHNALITGSDVWGLGVSTVSTDYSTTKGTMTDADRNAVRGRGVTNYLRLARDTGPLPGGGTIFLWQRIPIAQLLGFNNPVSYQWSTWVRSEYARQIGLSAYLDYGTGGSPSTGEIVGTPRAKLVQAGEWTRLTLDILLGDYLSKTLGSNMDAYLEVRVYLHQPNPGSATIPGGVDWNVDGYTDVTAAQLEAGVITSAFEEEGPFFSGAFGSRNLRCYALPTHPADVVNLEYLTGAGPAPIEFELLKFNIAPTVTASTEGELVWNPTDNTLDMWLSADVTLQVGQETVMKVVNETASQIDNGKAVALIGAQAATGRPSIELADIATRTRAWATVGIATENIPAGGEGFVTVQGLVRGVDTSGLAAGSSVFLNGVPGNLTNIPPSPPNSVVHVAVCMVSDASNGVLYVPTVNIIGTVEELTDTDVTGVVNGNVLTWDATAKVWSKTQSAVFSAASINVLTIGEATVSDTLAVGDSVTALYTFHTEAEVTATSGTTLTALVRAYSAPATASTASVAAINAQARHTGVGDLTNVTDGMRGSAIYAIHESAATVALLQGEVIYPQVSGGGAATTVYGLRIRGLLSGGSTATTWACLYLDAAPAATTVYGIYQAGSSDINYFGGNVHARRSLLVGNSVSSVTTGRVLEIQEEWQSNALYIYGVYQVQTIVPTTTRTASTYGMYSSLSLTTNFNYTGLNYGALYQVSHAGGGVVDEIYGVGCEAIGGGTGTITLAAAIRARVRTTNAAHTITEGIGLLIEAPQTTGTITTRYGIYQESAGDVNYFAGTTLAQLVRGEMYQDDTAATVALTLQNTWYPIVNGWSDSGNANDITRTTGTGRLTPLRAGTYLVLWSLSGFVGAVNQQLEVGVLKNGTIQASTIEEEFFASATTTYGLSGHGLVTANGTTDYFELAINNNTSAGRTFTIDHTTFTMWRIGD